MYFKAYIFNILLHRAFLYQHLKIAIMANSIIQVTIECSGLQNSQSTLNLWAICCFSWIPLSPLALMAFIKNTQQVFKNYWALSQLLFWADLGVCRGPSQLKFSQFSRKARSMTLETTGLSVTFQWLIKLWRKSLWEVLKNTWTAISHSQHGFMRKKSC